ncbi:uncharacterized protein BJ212DRAFT_1474500 [Suillus subaureus]|uniref:Uncharacterized protein n=1 Tax=Suillus subaureus TaxID=48587 RepID=A0A9P7EP14_9AGAM|nr:uncharacterized protein BJ212DRAFT_1474500 [Suillus subaureus]KAG1827346.1 hypothetical protein BJ212DRAFT_1474500 [Suillus subaureus]
MARSGHSTQLTSGRHRACQPQTQKLMENEISELKNYLPECTSAKRKEKQAVFTARLFAPKVDQAQWKKRKQMYMTWLFNNKKKKERREHDKEEVLQRIEDESRAKPGGPGMFKHYQVAVKRVMAELSNDKLEKVKETAEEWSNNSPPSKIQAQVTHKKGPVYMKHFLKEMWRQYGMRVLVMSAWKNKQGEVLFGMHDDNEALGDGDSFMKMKDWEDIEPVWQEYMQEQFSAGTWNGGQQMKGEICSGSNKAVMPWSAIIQSQDDFVTRKYVPANVDLKEPSKLQNWDTMALLNFWHAQQEKGKGLTFLFKAWKNKDGDMVASVASGNSPSYWTHKVRKQMIQRPQNSSTDTKSDPRSNPKSDSHHMEDDADDDVADSRSLQKRPRREPGPLTAHEGTAVLHAIPKPHLVKPAKTGALLTSRMDNFLAGLTDGVTSNVEEDVAMEGHTSLVLKNMWGKKW